MTDGGELALKTENIVVEASHENVIPVQKGGGCIRVADMGIGMDTEILHNIFDLFSLKNVTHGY